MTSFQEEGLFTEREGQGTTEKEERDEDRKKDGPSLPPAVLEYVETHGGAND